MRITPGPPVADARIRDLINHVVVPALLERFLREHALTEPDSAALQPRAVARVECPPSA